MASAAFFRRARTTKRGVISTMETQDTNKGCLLAPMWEQAGPYLRCFRSPGLSLVLVGKTCFGGDDVVGGGREGTAGILAQMSPSQERTVGPGQVGPVLDFSVSAH